MLWRQPLLLLSAQVLLQTCQPLLTAVWHCVAGVGVDCLACPSVTSSVACMLCRCAPLYHQRCLCMLARLRYSVTVRILNKNVQATPACIYVKQPQRCQCSPQQLLGKVMYALLAGCYCDLAGVSCWEDWHRCRCCDCCCAGLFCIIASCAACGCTRHQLPQSELYVQHVGSVGMS